MTYAQCSKYENYHSNNIYSEITRTELVSAILSSHKKLTYIHSGAGYGKTTLPAQVARLTKQLTIAEMSS